MRPDLFNVGLIAYDPDDAKKKVEPFYFDARRGPNAHSRDVGFSPNDLQMTTTAYPAVELLCLVGLQRCLPRENRSSLACLTITPGGAASTVAVPGGRVRPFAHMGRIGYRFENWYRTGQKKHKAFRSAIPISTGRLMSESSTVRPLLERRWSGGPRHP